MNNPGGWDIRSLVLRLIESLLSLYPPRFRHEFSAEIQEVILSRLHDAELRGRWSSAVLHEIAGLVPSIIQERWRALRSRKEITMIVAKQRPPWFFYLEWVFLNMLAIILAWYISSALISVVETVVGGTITVGGETRITEDFLFLYFLFPILGLLAGTLQYALLRRYFPRMGWWIAATLFGWTVMVAIAVIIIGVIIAPVPALGNSTFAIMLGMFLIGAITTLPQWWMLRQRTCHASWWILASAIGWSLIGLLNLVTSDLFPVLLGIALIPTIGTSLACWLLLDWFPRQEVTPQLT
jgi:hypothetical protein